MGFNAKEAKQREFNNGILKLLRYYGVNLSVLDYPSMLFSNVLQSHKDTLLEYQKENIVQKEAMNAKKKVFLDKLQDKMDENAEEIQRRILEYEETAEEDAVLLKEIGKQTGYKEAMDIFLKIFYDVE